MSNMITSSVIDGRTYYSAVRAGVEYTVQELGGGWFVGSHRKALGACATAAAASTMTPWLPCRLAAKPSPASTPC